MLGKKVNPQRWEDKTLKLKLQARRILGEE